MTGRIIKFLIGICFVAAAVGSSGQQCPPQISLSSFGGGVQQGDQITLCGTGGNLILSNDAPGPGQLTIDWGDGTSNTFNAATTILSKPQPYAFGTYTLRATQSGCGSTTTLTVLVGDSPSLDFNPLQPLGSICAPSEVDFQIGDQMKGNAPDTEYRVLVNGVVITTFNQAEINSGAVDIVKVPFNATSCGESATINGAVAQNAFAVQLEASNACTASPVFSTQGPVRVSTKPIPKISQQPPLLSCIDSCWIFSNASENINEVVGENCNFTVPTLWEISPGTQGVDWDLCGGGLDQQSVEVRFLNPGDYTVKMRINSSCGGQDSTQINVKIEEPTVAEADVQLLTGGTCVPTEVKLVNRSAGGNLSYNLTIDRSPGSGGASFINGTGSGSPEAEIRFTEWGDFRLELLTGGTCGTDVWDTTLTFRDQPAVNIQGLPDLCDQGIVSLNATNVTFDERGSPITSYEWTIEQGGVVTGTSTNQFPDPINFNTPGIKSIVAKVTNQCSEDTERQSFEVIASPTLTMPPRDTFCKNDAEVFFTATPSRPGGSGFWSGPGILNPPEDGRFDPIAANEGSNTLQYTYTLGPCTVDDDFIVDVLPLPVVDLNQNDVTYCLSDAPVQLDASPAGGTWTPLDGADLSPDGLFSPGQSGPSTFRLLYTSLPDANTGCFNTDTLDVLVERLPTVVARDTLICDSPIPAQLVGAQPLNGTWSDDGSGAIVDANQGLFDPVAAGGLSGAPYKVFYTFTNPNGCTNVDSALVSLRERVPIDAGPDQTFCLDAPDFNLNSNVNDLTGVWDLNGNPSLIGTTFVPRDAGVGNYDYIYRLDEGNCQVTDTLNIVVNPLPTISLAGNPNLVCESEDTLQLLASPAGGRWFSLDGAAVDTSGQLFPQATPPGLYTLTYLTGADGNGCQNSEALPIRVQQLPAVNVNDQLVCTTTLTLDAGSPAGGIWRGPGIVDANNGVFDPGLTAGPAGSPYDITYTVTDNVGCSNTDTAVIQVIPLPTVEAGPNETICFDGGAQDLTGFSPAGGTWTGAGIVNGALGTFDPVVAGAGSYTLTYTYATPNTNNCQVSDTKIVTVVDLTQTDAGNDSTLCLDNPTVQLEGQSPQGGIFSGPGIVDGRLGTFDPAAAGVGTHVITYRAESGVCFFDATRTVEVNPMPESDFSVDSFACTGDLLTFTNNSATGIQAQWDFADGSPVNPTFSPVKFFSAAGRYDVKLVMANNFGCIDSISKPIQIEGPPTVDFTTNPKRGCAPLEVSFTNLSSGFQADYRWNFGNGQSLPQYQPGSVTYRGGEFDTTYVVNLTATNVCGTREHLDTITVLPLPIARLQVSADSGCSPLTVAFSNLSGGEATSFVWDFDNGNTSAQAIPPTQVYSVPDFRDTASIRLVAENGCGRDTVIRNVIVDPPDVRPGFFLPNPQGCTPHDIAIQNQAFPASATVFWDFGDGTTSREVDPSHRFNRPGEFRVTQIVANSCGSDTALTVVKVNPLPAASFVFSDFPCALDTVQFINGTSGANAFIWSFGDGDTSFVERPFHVFDSGGVYDVSLIAFDSLSGCPGTFSGQINVRDVPNPMFTPQNTNGCVPLTVNFTNETTGDFFYQWDFGDGNSSVEENPTNTYQDDGNFTVTLTAFDDFGCDNQATFSPVIGLPVPVADFEFDPDRQCELPVSLQFQNTSQGANGYRWAFEEGAQSTAVNPSHTYRSIGPKTIQLIAINAISCRDTIQKDFLASVTPQADFVWDPGEGCRPLTVNFRQESINATGYRWDFGDGSTEVGPQPTHTYQEDGTYSVQMVADFQEECFDTVFLPDLITAFPAPFANFQFRQLTTSDGRNSGTFEFTNLTNGGDQFEWDFGDGTTSTEVDPVHTYSTNGEKQVTLYAISPNACNDTITIPVFPELITALYVPNVFSPEGTGDEEVRVFKPKGIGLTEYRIEVFSRNGERIWESTALVNGSPAESWDGRVGGKLVDQGSYSWRASARFQDGTAWRGMPDGEGGFKRQGSVTVIR